MAKSKSTFFPDIMLDLETMGNVPGCVITSIGAVEFNLHTGKIGSSIYISVDMQSALDIGLFIQADTIKWWMRQNEEARLLISNDSGINIIKALESFSRWYGPNPKTRKIWGNGLGFDVSLLKVAYYKAGLVHPWGYDRERDLRTLLDDLDPSTRYKIKFEGVRHEPISDCKHQIKQAIKAFDAKNHRPNIKKTKTLKPKKTLVTQ